MLSVLEQLESNKEESINIFRNMTVPMILVEKDGLFVNFLNDYVVKVQSDIS